MLKQVSAVWAGLDVGKEHHRAVAVDPAGHLPTRCNRMPNRVFYTSALISIRCCPACRTYYDRKRAAGKKHAQAVLVLARRVNVVRAPLRDNRPCAPGLPEATAA